MQNWNRSPRGARDGKATALLDRWSQGDDSALAELMPLVYADLRRIANRSLQRERDAHTLQPTALVHESYLRLQKGRALDIGAGRDHFLRIAARLMRQILVDHARRTHAARRDGGAPRTPLTEAESQSGAPDTTLSVDFLALHSALERLARQDRRKAQVIELRYFGGYNVSEVARLLGVSEPTVIADTRLARAWLLDRLDVPSTE